jgi:hypothetical protein
MTSRNFGSFQENLKEILYDGLYFHIQHISIIASSVAFVTIALVVPAATLLLGG